MGVRANYFTCGTCADAQLGWYERYTAEAVEEIKNKSVTFDVGKGRLISIDGKQWVFASSKVGTAITRSIYRKCPDTFRQCFPSSDK